MRHRINKVPPTIDANSADSAEVRDSTESANNLSAVVQTSLVHVWVFTLLMTLLQALLLFNGEFSLDANDGGNYWEPLHFMIYGRGISNWEWHPDWALRSPVMLLIPAALGRAVAFLGFSSSSVFYVCRMLFSALGIYSFHWLSYAVAVRVGARVSFFLCILLLSTHHVQFYLARLSLDSVLVSLNALVMSQWLLRRRIALTLGALVVVFRINYAIVYAAIVLDYALYPVWKNRSNLSATRNATLSGLIRVAFHVVVASVAFCTLFALVDSVFYGRFTFSTLNHLWFNVVENRSHWFGKYWPKAFYADIFARDQNALLLIFAAVGARSSAVQRKWRFLLLVALPFVLSLIHLQMMTHKQERFVIYIFPLLLVFGALGLDSLFHFSALRSVCVALMLFFSWSAMSLHAIDISSSYDAANFYRAVHREIKSNSRFPANCATTWPFSSWALHDCERLYFVQLQPEFWPGSNNEQYLRLENLFGSGDSAAQASRSALLASYSLNSSHLLYRQLNNAWLDERLIVAYRNTVERRSLESNDNGLNEINFVICAGGIGIPSTYLSSLYKGLSPRDATESLQSRAPLGTFVAFGEYLLGSDLWDSFQLVARHSQLVHRYDVDFLERNSGLWLWTRSDRAEKVFRYSLWRRK